VYALLASTTWNYTVSARPVPPPHKQPHRNIDDCNIPKRAKPIAEPRIAYAGTQPFCHSRTQLPNVHQEAEKKMGRQSEHPVFPSFDWPEVVIASLHVGHTTSLYCLDYLITEVTRWRGTRAKKGFQLGNARAAWQAWVAPSSPIGDYR
jgi:hypothetical protein